MTRFGVKKESWRRKTMAWHTEFDQAWDIVKEDKYCEFCGKPGDFPKYEEMGGLRTCDSCYDSEQQGFLDFSDAERSREMNR